MGADPAEPPGSDPNCAFKLTKVGQIVSYYDPSSELVNLVATLKNGSYAGWGWGGSMTNTEMVIFSADASSSGVSFVYGIGDDTPENDDAYGACYDTKFVENGDGTVTLTATRPLECTGV